MINRIKKIRINKGFGLNETARNAGITGGYLSSLERGEKQNPTLETLIRLSKVLNVSINELLGEELKQNEETNIGMYKETFITLSREEFKELSEFILDESSEENNNISIFTQDGSIKFGIDRVRVEVLSEYWEGEVK